MDFTQLATGRPIQPNDGYEPVDVNAPTTPRRPYLLGALIGLVAAIAGLAIAEFVAAFSSSLQSPVLDVGDRVVDSVPNSIKQLAISWFGTNDKVALLIGIAVLLAIYAAAMGAIAVSGRWKIAIAGIGLFGLVGAYASQTSRRPAEWYAVFPSLIGGAAAAGILIWLRSELLGRRSDEPTSTEQPQPATTGSALATVEFDRRRFALATAGTAVGATALGLTSRAIGTSTQVDNQRNELGLPVAKDPLAPIPDAVTVDVAGAVPFFTPNEEFYRIDTALTVPQVSVSDWQLRITGMVDNEITLSYDELLNRQPIESDITLTCVSNTVGGQLVGTARWLGFRLDDLLAEAGIQAGANQIVGRSVDGYTCGFPVAALDGRDALIAIGQNGEPLPLEHGYPARLIVPGLYGYVSATKWLTEIELTTFDAFDQYWVERDWVEQAPIRLQSRIDTPAGLSKPKAGLVPVAGVAWAQTRGIEGVQISIDDGDWVDCELAAALNDVTWRQWSYAWEATPGRHALQVRAIETGGAIQTADRAEPFPSGATGLHQIIVLVE